MSFYEPVEQATPFAKVATSSYLSDLRHNLFKGGRLIKVKGITSSVAPEASQLGVGFLLALGVSLGSLGFSSSAMAGSCTLTPPGDLLCSGPAVPGTDTTVLLNTANPIMVTTTADFGIESNVGRAFDLRGVDGVSFVQTGNGSIIGAGAGVNLHNQTSGDISFTAVGDVKGLSGMGIEVTGGAGTGDVTLNVGNVESNAGVLNDAIHINHNGTGNVTVNSTGTLSGKVSSDGIFVGNTANGQDITVNANVIEGTFHGAHIESRGKGAVSVTAASITGVQNALDIVHLNGAATGGMTVDVSGDVTSTGDRGIEFTNVAGTTDIHVGGNIAAGTYGIRGATNGEGELRVVVDGKITTGSAQGVEVANNNANNTGTYIEVNEIDSGGGGVIVLSDNGVGKATILANGPIDAANGRGLAVATGANSAGIEITALDSVRSNNNFGIYAVGGGQGDIVIQAESVTTTGANAIVVDNNGTGAASITANGAVATTGAAGIQYAGAASNTTATIVANQGVTAFTRGIEAIHNGSGLLTVETKGLVEGTAWDGIRADSTSGVTVRAEDTKGGNYGIVVRGVGTGSALVESTGTAQGSVGIEVVSQGASTGVEVNANAIIATGTGIHVDQSGTGSASITATGLIKAGGIGIHANNTTNATDINITAADIVAGNHGIYVFASDGKGGLNIKADNITSTGGSGIHADNTGASTTGTKVEVGTIDAAGWGIELQDWSSAGIDINVGDIISGNDGITVDNFYNAAGTAASSGTKIVVNSVTAGVEGIDVRDYTQGGIDITTRGKVTATGGAGILAELSANGTDVKVNAQDDVSGTNWGIWALNHSTTGTMTIDSKGLASGGATDGIRADHAGAGLVINAEDTQGGNFGIYVPSVGTAGLDLTSTGSAVGVTDDGIFVSSNNNSTHLNLTVNNAKGAGHGIAIVHHSDVGTPDNDATINVSGVIQGGSGYGIYSDTDPGVMTRINIADTATVQSTGNNAVFNADGDSVTTVAAGATVAGAFRLTTGSDDLIFNGTDLSNVTLLDGGDDTTNNANGNDRLFLNGYANLMLDGSKVTGWEEIPISATTLTLSNTLTVGSAAVGQEATGLRLLNGSVLDFTQNPTITGRLYNDATVRGADGVVGNTLTVNGAYNAGANAALDLDVDFTADSADKLVVNGNVTGITAVTVADLSTGAASGNDVRVVDVSGDNPTGSFVLAVGPINAGGTYYALEQDTSASSGWDLIQITAPPGPVSCDQTESGATNAVLGCVTDDTLLVNGDAVIADEVQGGGGRDVIQITGNAQVASFVRGGGQGADGSAANDTGDLITIDTTSTVGGVQGNLGDDQIWVLNGTVQGDVEGNEGNDTIVLNGPNAQVLGGIDGGIGNDVIALLEGQVDQVLGGDGDDEASWDAGKVSVARIDLGTGSDRLTVTNGAGGLGTTVLDGGDDTSATDGWVDTLTLNGVQHQLNEGQLVNWEAINLYRSSIAATGTLAAGNVNLTEGSTLNGLNQLALTGNLSIDPSSRFVGHGGGQGVYSVAGNVRNDGIVTLRDGVSGDSFDVAGDYSGSGQLLLDVDFGTGSADALTVDGAITNSDGVTTVVVTDVGDGLALGQSMDVISAAGGLGAGSFQLAGLVSQGVWDYSLVQDGQSLKLASKVSSVGAVYEGASAVLLDSFASLPTMEQRVGQRQWLSRNESGGTQLEGLWLRVNGDHSELRPESSLSGFSSKATTTSVQAGVDFVKGRSDSGHWVFGVTGQYGHLDSTLTNAAGRGTVDGSSYGVGLTASWHGAKGTYVDSQVQVNRVSMDIATDAHGELVNGQHRTALSAGVEVGHKFDLAEGKHFLVPQAQLSWGRMGSSSFDDQRANSVSFDNAEQLIGRLGLAYQYRPGGEDIQSGGNADGKMIYVIGNILHDFASANDVTVSGTKLAARGQRTWAEVGVGGSVQLSKNSLFYGEAAYRTSVSGDASGNQGVSANVGVGVRVAW